MRISGYLSGEWGFYREKEPMVQFHDRVWGPDVSSWQGDVDWNAVKADGASFGITKITEGVNYVNPFAAQAWANMGRAGLGRVQYHYARPAILTAQVEADYFLAHMLPLADGDIVALDLETDSRDGPFSNGAFWASMWLGMVRDVIGFAPILYCNGGILSDRSQRFAEFPDLGKLTGLWLASWNEVFPKAVPPWDTVALWQFTNSGRVPGIDGFVDLNIFNGTLDTMKKYGKPPVANGGDTGGNPSDLRGRVADLFRRLDVVDGDIRQLLESAHQLMSGWKDA